MLISGFAIIRYALLCHFTFGSGLPEGGSLHQISVEDFCCMHLLPRLGTVFNNNRPQSTMLYYSFKIQRI